MQLEHGSCLSKVHSLVQYPKHTSSILELSDVSDKTILFSDRPDRIVGSTKTTDLVGNWSIGENNFAVGPPNAFDDISAENATATTISFDLPSEFGQSTLVIDDDAGDWDVCLDERVCQIVCEECS